MNPEDPEVVKANVAKLVAAGAPDQDIHDYIEAAGHPLADTATPHGTPLQGQMGHPIVDASPEAPIDPRRQAAEAALAHVLNIAQGIPGMEAVEAGAGMVGGKLSGQPLTYQQSLDALRSKTEKIGGVTSAVEHAAGTIPLLPFLAASPALAGAELGGADQLLNADPNLNLAERGGRTLLGAGGGAIIGKGADMLVAGGRAALPSLLGGTKDVAINLLDRATARAASAKRLYSAALDEGRSHVTPPAIESYLKEPDIAEIVDELRKTREFKNLSPESPEMLDAIYKTLSDRVATVKKGLLSVTPNKPNIGRFQAKDLAAAQQAGLTAMDATMPTYRAAVKDFAQHKAAEDAVGRGYDAMRTGLLKNLPAARNLTRTTPEAFGNWAETAGQDETKAAVEGILGATKKMIYKNPLTTGRNAAALAPSLLRAAGDVTATYGPRAGLLAARQAY